VPKELEQRLKRQAHKKGYTGEREDRYVYGTMYKLGWRPSKKGGKKK
jgi:hypothetical protein